MNSATPSKSSASDHSVGFSATFDTELRQLICARTGIVVQDHQAENLYKTVATAMQRYGHAQAESFMDSLRAEERRLVFWTNGRLMWVNPSPREKQGDQDAA